MQPDPHEFARLLAEGAAIAAAVEADPQPSSATRRVTDAALEALALSKAQADLQAASLIGARFGSNVVRGRVTPDTEDRARFMVDDERTRHVTALPGHELIRLVRSAERNGISVIVPKADVRPEGRAA